MKWLIKRYMCMHCIESIAELSKLTGITRRTLYDRINDPRTFRLFEIKALDDVLMFSDDDLMSLIRGKA